MRTLVPGYPAVMAALENGEEVHSFAEPVRRRAGFWRAAPSASISIVLDAPHLFDRPGNPYVGPDGVDWPDNAFRFGALAKVGASYRPRAAASPGLFPTSFMRTIGKPGSPQPICIIADKPRPGTVITVHNLAYQGQFPANLLGALDLPQQRSFTFSGVEHYGAIGFLKAALQLSDRITTVSPTYAVEIQRPETGMGFDGLLRERSERLCGILNGIDTDVWNPSDRPDDPGKL